MEFNSIIPELSVVNIDKSLQFYIETIGFKVEYLRQEAQFAFISFQGTQLMIEQQNGNWEIGTLEYPFGRGINFQIRVLDVDTIIESLKTANYPLMQEVKVVWYRMNEQMVGHKEFLVQDPDGYLLRFAERIHEES